MWNALIDLLASIIDWFFSWTGNFGVAVILFTILVKGLLLPLDIKSKKSTYKMQELTPELDRIKERYKNDPEKQSRKMQELYKKNNVSMFGGCLPMLLTLPLLIILFAALRKIAAEHMYEYMANLLIAKDAAMEGLLAEISTLITNSSEISMSMQDILPSLFNNAGELPSNLSKLPEVITQEKFDMLSATIKSIEWEQARIAAQESGYSFLWIKNIWAPDSPLKSLLGTGIEVGNIFNGTQVGLCNGWFILPILSTVTQYLQTFLMNPNKKKNKKKNDPTANQMKWMNYLMPLMSLYFCITYNSAFALYWTVSNFIAIAQSLITNYIRKKKAEKQEVVNL